MQSIGRVYSDRLFHLTHGKKWKRLERDNKTTGTNSILLVPASHPCPCQPPHTSEVPDCGRVKSWPNAYGKILRFSFRAAERASLRGRGRVWMCAKVYCVGVEFVGVYFVWVFICIRCVTAEKHEREKRETERRGKQPRHAATTTSQIFLFFLLFPRFHGTREDALRDKCCSVSTTPAVQQSTREQSGCQRRRLRDET